MAIPLPKACQGERPRSRATPGPARTGDHLDRISSCFLPAKMAWILQAPSGSSKARMSSALEADRMARALAAWAKDSMTHLRVWLPRRRICEGRTCRPGGLGYSVGRAKTGQSSLPTRRRPVFCLVLVHLPLSVFYCGPRIGPRCRNTSCIVHGRGKAGTWSPMSSRTARKAARISPSVPRALAGSGKSR